MFLLTILAQTLNNKQSSPLPYTNNRPSYAKGQVDAVWNNAADLKTGLVQDPSGAFITWDRSLPQGKQWHMGHLPDQRYSVFHEMYLDESLSKEEFLKWYRNPQNYRPELPATNYSHKYE